MPCELAEQLSRVLVDQSDHFVRATNHQTLAVSGETGTRDCIYERYFCSFDQKLIEIKSYLSQNRYPIVIHLPPM